MVVLLMLGCSTATSSFGFGSGGERYDVNVPDTGGDTAGDSGDSGGGDSGGEPGAPVITSFILTWYEIGNQGFALFADIEYVDDEDDVMGGKVFYTLSGGAEDENGLEVVEAGDDIEDGAAYGQISDESGNPEVFFAIADLDDGKDYAMDVFLRDKAGHESSAKNAALEPNEDGGK